MGRAVRRTAIITSTRKVFHTLQPGSRRPHPPEVISTHPGGGEKEVRRNRLPHEWEHGNRVIRDDLIVQVGTEKHAATLKQHGAKSFDMTGRPMRGWVMVSPTGCSTDLALENWFSMALDFVKTRPAK